MVNTGGCSSGMEPEEDKKTPSDDMVMFMRKRSETDAPRYTAKLKTYVDFQQKRRRAAAARRRSEHKQSGKRSPARKTELDQRDKSGDNSEQRGAEDERNNRKRVAVEKGFHGPRSPSRSHSNEPVDRCRKRRRCRRRRSRRRRRCRRRRSRGRRRRRRCSRRRRRRSCSRRRRRRSCLRRRRRRRCCR